MPSLDFPEMDMSESGISKMEIINCILRDVGALYNENRVKITGLESSFPFDLKFLINFKNVCVFPKAFWIIILRCK